MRLQELLVEEAEADQAMGMRVNRGQPMAVAHVEGAESEIELYRIVE